MLYKEKYSLIWECNIIRASKFVWAHNEPFFLSPPRKGLLGSFRKDTTSLLLHNKHSLTPHPVYIPRKENSWYMKEKLAHTFQDNFRFDSSLDYSNYNVSGLNIKHIECFRKEYLFLKVRLCVQPSRKAPCLFGLPQACGIKVSCASLVCCGLWNHIELPVSCSSFNRWKILPCSSVPGREALWERWIGAQRGVQAMRIPVRG